MVRNLKYILRLRAKNGWVTDTTVFEVIPWVIDGIAERIGKTGRAGPKQKNDKAPIVGEIGGEGTDGKPVGENAWKKWDSVVVLVKKVFLENAKVCLRVEF